MLRGPVLFEFCFHLESLASALFAVAATQYQTAGVWAAPGPTFSAAHVRVGVGRTDGGHWGRWGFHADSVGAVLASENPISWKSGTGVNRQILFLWSLRRAQNQACRDEWQKGLS